MSEPIKTKKRKTEDDTYENEHTDKEQKTSRGKVYIAAMNLRGQWATKPVGALLLNVTSAQRKDSLERRDFSPMTPVKGTYKGYWNFESYWQSGKVFEHMDRDKQLAWWKGQKAPRRRYPGSKGANVLYAEHQDGIKRNYIESRKQVYVPEYYEMIKDRDSIHKWTKIVQEGQDVVVYDFDGPRGEQAEPLCLELTPELFGAKLNFLTHPFGHGFIVAGIISGIYPQLQYTL